MYHILNLCGYVEVVLDGLSQVEISFEEALVGL